MLLVRNSNFRLLWSASAVGNLGDGISSLAFPWLAALLTRDPVLIGAVAAAGRLPWLLFSIPAGVLTDAVDRRRLMVGADLLRLCLMLAVVGLIVTLPALPLPDGTDALPLIGALAAVAFLLGMGEVVRDNAAQTALPSIVAAADLETANGQLWTVEEVMGRFIGPPLAGLLIALAVPVPFLADAATFGIAAALVWAITLAPRLAAPPTGTIWRQMRDGMTWLWGAPYLLYLALFLGVLNFTSSAIMTLLVLVGQDLLGLDATQYGLLLAAGAVGGILGGLFGAGVVRRLGGSIAVPLAVLAMAAEPAVVALGGGVVPVAAGLFATGFAGVVYNIVTVSFRQRMIPDALLGRVNSIYRFFGWGAIPLGALAGGALVSWAEPGLGREAALRLPYHAGMWVMLLMAGLAALTLRFPRA